MFKINTRLTVDDGRGGGGVGDNWFKFRAAEGADDEFMGYKCFGRHADASPACSHT